MTHERRNDRRLETPDVFVEGEELAPEAPADSLHVPLTTLLPGYHSSADVHFRMGCATAEAAAQSSALQVLQGIDRTISSVRATLSPIDKAAQRMQAALGEVQPTVQELRGMVGQTPETRDPESAKQSIQLLKYFTEIYATEHRLMANRYGEQKVLVGSALTGVAVAAQACNAGSEAIRGNVDRSFLASDESKQHASAHATRMQMTAKATDDIAKPLAQAHELLSKTRAFKSLPLGNFVMGEVRILHQSLLSEDDPATIEQAQQVMNNIEAALLRMSGGFSVLSTENAQLSTLMEQAITAVWGLVDQLKSPDTDAHKKPG
jgi:hypothetical protein